MDSIIQTLEKRISAMEGNWILPKNNYEKDFSTLLKWEDKKGRYADATNGITDIEYKKGQGAMWFDMVRYAEIYKGIGTQNTVTLFFRYDKKEKYVRDICVIDTKKLLHFMKMTDELADFCIQLHKNAPRGINMQMSATYKDMKAMSYHIVSKTKPNKKRKTGPEIFKVQKKLKIINGPKITNNYLPMKPLTTTA